jgi:hypothetical protein
MRYKCFNTGVGCLGSRSEGLNGALFRACVSQSGSNNDSVRLRPDERGANGARLSPNDMPAKKNRAKVKYTIMREACQFQTAD